jgi:hypothetical protein
VLSRPARALTFAVAGLFGALGVFLYLAPAYAAPRMPWPVSEFLAMTMGAWYVGSAVFAWRAGKDPSWSRSHALLLYVWAFSIGQALVLLLHADDLKTEKALAWPYMLVVAAAALASIVGIVDVVRRRPPRRPEGAPAPRWLRVAPGVFTAIVALLALPLLDGYDNPRSIWPGQLTLISARSFAVFFAALAISAAPLAVARGITPLVVYLRAGLVLNVTILAAAVVHFDRFDLADHPGQLIYLGLYAVVLAATVALLSWASGQSAR